MKVIGICSSARKQGNTALLIRTVFGELEREGIETELLEFAGSVVEPCKACWACGGKGNCVHRRDPFCGVFEKLKEADGVILGSPVYSANISANMQAFLERAAVVCDMNPGLMRHKVGAAVSAVRRAGGLQAVDAMNHFFLNHEMIVAGATYWNVSYGRMPGEVESDTEGMDTMRSLGQNMAYVLWSLHRDTVLQ